MATLVAAFDMPDDLDTALNALYEARIASQDIEVFDRESMQGERQETPPAGGVIAGSESSPPLMSSSAAATPPPPPAVSGQSLDDWLAGLDIDDEEAAYLARVVSDGGGLLAVTGEPAQLARAQEVISPLEPLRLTRYG